MQKPYSIQKIEEIQHALQGLKRDFVFVGGATLPYYIPSVFWPNTRPTDDVDVVLKMLTRSQTTKIEKDLLRLGFKNATGPGVPLCRFTFQDIIVDVLSTDTNAMGFTNSWYAEGFDRAVPASDAGPNVKIFTLPYFLASKLEAFRSRGKEDYRGSKDMEDVISLLEVSAHGNLEGMLGSASKRLVTYLKTEFRDLSSTEDFIEAIPAALFQRQLISEATEKVLERMRVIAMR